MTQDFREKTKDINYFEYLYTNYIATGKLTPETIKARVVNIGKELKSYRKAVGIGEAAFAKYVKHCGFKCTNTQVRRVEAGKGYNVYLLSAYSEVIKALMEEKNIRFELNKLFN